MNSTRQVVTDNKNDAIGAVINAPSGTPIKPNAESKPRSFGAAQFAFVLFIVENNGPSENPKRTRKTPKPASAEPPKTASPSSPAKAMAISNTDHNVPATIQTNLGPFLSDKIPPNNEPSM